MSQTNRLGSGAMNFKELDRGELLEPSAVARGGGSKGSPLTFAATAIPARIPIAALSTYPSTPVS